MKKISNVFVLLAVLLSDVMCAVVGVNYGKMVFGGENAGYSAPPIAAFIWAIPFLIAIVICLILAISMKKRGK